MWCHGKSCTCFNFLTMLCRLKAHIFCEQNYFVLASLQELRSHDWHWFCSSNPNYHICCVVDNSVVYCAQLCMLYITLGLSVALWFNRSSIYRQWISSLVPWHPSSTHACPSVEFCGPFKKGQPPRRILHGVRQITSGILRLCRPFGMTATNGRDLWPTSCRVLRQHWCPCFGQMDFYLIGKGVSVLDVIVAIRKRQPLKSVVACQSTDAALTIAKPTSIHTMLIPSSSKAHSFGNPGCSAPASSQSCFACCCSSPSTSQSQSHWRYGQTRLPIAWSLGGGARKIHSLWHRTKMARCGSRWGHLWQEGGQQATAVGAVVRPGTTGRPDTLVLHRLRPLPAKLRAPGPGAVRKVEWMLIAKNWLQNRNMILHTDLA